ncbi:MAG: hypothetical protein R2784_18965, partial [Saprospiraceae bacterium]
WQNEGTLETIRTGEWDYVVLQEQSKLGMGVMIDNDMYFGQTERFFEHARKFDIEIKKANAKTVFLMTWSVKDQPNEQAILTYAYTTIAKELQALVVPVGLVWDKVRMIPTINLYADDGGHPSPEGSYLTAVTLYSTIMSDDPIGLSETVSGYRLSSSGERSLDEKVLINVAKEDAQLIQKASWEVVESMQKLKDYMVFEEPAPSYTIPVLNKGESIELKDIIGKWYGTSTYGSEYLGQIMEIKEKGGKPEINLSFYTPHQQDAMSVDNAVIKQDQLILSFYDSLRTRSATLRISLNRGKMEGILESSGNFQMYKHLYFSRETVHNEIDLSALASLLESFQSNIVKEGYVKAVLKHYEQYSKLIGDPFKPEEFYLNAVGYNFLQEGKVNDAMNAFELTTVYYPHSVNAYDSYAEALIVAGRKDEALAVYEKVYQLAKRQVMKILPISKRIWKN